MSALPSASHQMWTRFLEYKIDHNGFLVLKLACASDGSGIVGRLYSPFLPDSRLVRNIIPLLSLAVLGQEAVFSLPSGEFFMPFFVPPQNRLDLRLYLNGNVLASFDIDKDGQLRLSPYRAVRQLCVMETRMIGRLPHGMHGLYQDRKLGFRGQTPLTDLHTHLSAQISGADLIQLGLSKNILYPTAALKKLKIDFPQSKIVLIPRRDFLPLAHLNLNKEPTEPAVPLMTLSPEGLKALQFALSLSPEMQGTFEDIEMGFYLREPFTKEITLFPDILRSVAKRYAEQGIVYAELSANAIIDLLWLKVVHEVMPEIEKETWVQLRFLVGIPRNLEDTRLQERIHRIQKISASPYIVGVDILGYEMNKTSYLSQHLEHLAGWMRDQEPDLTLRLHAGEIQKNAQNVKECLDLAQRYGIRMRIGHAVYGVDAETKALARELAAQGKIIFEFNPDSNLAGNNIDFPNEVPLAEFTAKHIPSVLSSDGAGLYMTSGLQTALAGGLCGLTERGSLFIRQVEKDHIALQQEIFDRKVKALPHTFLESFIETQPIQTKSFSTPFVKKDGIEHDLSPLELKIKNDPCEGRRPILMAGAAGSSWDALNPKDQQQIQLGLTLLLQYLDPEKVCFVTGRTKDRGVGIVLGQAIAAFNQTHLGQESSFRYVMMMAEGGAEPDRFIPEGVSHHVELKVPLVFLPHAVLTFIKERKGLAYFAGGRSFTRDFIVEASRQHIPYGLMQGVVGASADKGRVYPQKCFWDAEDMLKYARAVHPELFL
jgi:hypothetical protein